MKNTWLWLIGIGAVAFFYFKKTATAATTTAAANTTAAGLSSAYQGLIANPSADNITAFTNAVSTGLGASTSSIKSFFGNAAAPVVPVKQTVSQADVNSALASGAESDAASASTDTLDGWDGTGDGIDTADIFT